MSRWAAVLIAVLVLCAPFGAPAARADGYGAVEPEPTATASADGALVGSVSGAVGVGPAVASNAVSGPQSYRYRLVTPCAAEDAASGACSPGVYSCAQPDDRVVGYYLVQQQRLLTEPPVDAVFVPAGTALGAPYGTWVEMWRGCVDVTDLDLGPTQAEVFARFENLPFTGAVTGVQPPGGQVLVGLPTIFYSEEPTELVFTVDIRGFTVVLTARAQRFTWHTGDGAAVVTSSGPGAPYPNETVTYDYTSGDYTVYVTVTWGATFTVNGGAVQQMVGTVDIEGPPVQFTAVQARAVLTDPYN